MMELHLIKRHGRDNQVGLGYCKIETSTDFNSVLYDIRRWCAANVRSHGVVLQMSEPVYDAHLLASGAGMQALHACAPAHNMGLLRHVGRTLCCLSLINSANNEITVAHTPHRAAACCCAVINHACLNLLDMAIQYMRYFGHLPEYWHD